MHGEGMDHVTYILIMFRYAPSPPLGPSLTPHSLAFLIYTIIIVLINLYSTSGRNAAPAVTENAIELTTPSAKWYARVPVADEAEAGPVHVLGDDDE